MPFEFGTVKYGARRDIVINGVVYFYESRDVRQGEDRFLYTLPNGEAYSHPTAEGCLIAILKHASDNS